MQNTQGESLAPLGCLAKPAPPLEVAPWPVWLYPARPTTWQGGGEIGLEGMFLSGGGGGFPRQEQRCWLVQIQPVVPSIETGPSPPGKALIPTRFHKVHKLLPLSALCSWCSISAFGWCDFRLCLVLLFLRLYQRTTSCIVPSRTNFFLLRTKN